MTAASMLARSRTAWTAFATALVAIIGPRLDLTADETASLIVALQGIVATLYVQDKRSKKR